PCCHLVAHRAIRVSPVSVFLSGDRTVRACHQAHGQRVRLRQAHPAPNRRPCKDVGETTCSVNKRARNTVNVCTSNKYHHVNQRNIFRHRRESTKENQGDHCRRQCD